MMILRSKNCQSGLTLVELVVAAMIIAVILSGVMAFSITVKSNQDTTYKSSILSFRMMAVMSFLVKDASLAVGDASDPGILTYSNADDRQICFRQDVNDPASYADDDWVCYLHGASFHVRRIELDTAVSPPDQLWWDACKAVTCPARKLWASVVPDFFNVVTDAQGRVQYIDFTITTRYDEYSPADPLTNPEYTLQTRVNPTMHTR